MMNFIPDESPWKTEFSDAKYEGFGKLPYIKLKSFDFSSMKDMGKLVYKIVFESNALQNGLFFHSLMNIINNLCDDH